MDGPFDRSESILRWGRADYKAETSPSLSSIEAALPTRIYRSGRLSCPYEPQTATRDRPEPRAPGGAPRPAAESRWGRRRGLRLGLDAPVCAGCPDRLPEGGPDAGGGGR